MSKSKLNSDELNIASGDVNQSEPQFNPNLMPEGGQLNICGCSIFPPHSPTDSWLHPIAKAGEANIQDSVKLCKSCGMMKHLDADGLCGRCIAKATSEEAAMPMSGETHDFVQPNNSKSDSVDEAANDAELTVQANNTTVGSRLSHDVADERLSPLQGDDTTVELSHRMGMYADARERRDVKAMTRQLAAVHRDSQIRVYEYMLQCERDNKDAGHKWSSGDWRKFVEYELAQLRGEG